MTKLDVKRYFYLLAAVAWVWNGWCVVAILWPLNVAYALVTAGAFAVCCTRTLSEYIELLPSSPPSGAPEA